MIWSRPATSANAPQELVGRYRVRARSGTHLGQAPVDLGEDVGRNVVVVERALDRADQLAPGLGVKPEHLLQERAVDQLRILAATPNTRLDGWSEHTSTIGVMVDRSLLEQVLRLPDDERLKLADVLRESVAYRDPELTDEVRATLDDAERDAEENPLDERPWSQARGELFPHLA